jgi:hypothetical protein
VESEPAAMSATPRQLLSATDGILLVVGMVIGAGIFKAPSIVAANVSSALEFMLVWVAGGIASLARVHTELSGGFRDRGR